MKVLAIRPAPPGSGSTRARFDVEMDDGTKIRDLKLVQSRQGWRVYAPQRFGMSLITFTPAIVDRLAAEALRHVEHTA
ncbi:MAG: hypothetical protein JNK47_16765 [Mesorhizobium sp.]|nr:hypothetical protein [Mesorhizobium sp.]MBL8578877.1 hypothetical protein [Mesorhizobium sp.]